MPYDHVIAAEPEASLDRHAVDGGVEVIFVESIRVAVAEDNGNGHGVRLAALEYRTVVGIDHIAALILPLYAVFPFAGTVIVLDRIPHACGDRGGIAERLARFGLGDGHRDGVDRHDGGGEGEGVLHAHMAIAVTVCPFLGDRRGFAVDEGDGLVGEFAVVIGVDAELNGILAARLEGIALHHAPAVLIPAHGQIIDIVAPAGRIVHRPDRLAADGGLADGEGHIAHRIVEVEGVFQIDVPALVAVVIVADGRIVLVHGAGDEALVGKDIVVGGDDQRHGHLIALALLEAVALVRGLGGHIVAVGDIAPQHAVLIIA